MKKIFLLLLFSIFICNAAYSYSISLGSTSLGFGSYTPTYAWGDQINSPNWANAPQAKFTITIGWETSDATNNKTVKVYCFFQNKNHASYPTDPQKISILNAVYTQRGDSGLSGLINFDTVSTSNVESSFIPVRLAISTDQYELITDDYRWIWLQDYDIAYYSLPKLDYAKILQFTSSTIQTIQYYCTLKASATIENNSGKEAGSYVGRLFIMSDLQ